MSLFRCAPPVRFLPTAPSFVVVVELQQLIAMTSRRGDQSEGTGLQRLGQSQGALRAVTSTRDCWYSSRKGHDWAKRGRRRRRSGRRSGRSGRLSPPKGSAASEVELPDFRFSEDPHSQVHLKLHHYYEVCTIESSNTSFHGSFLSSPPHQQHTGYKAYLYLIHGYTKYSDH